MSRMIQRLFGRVYGWFESKDARPVSKPLPAKFSRRTLLALQNLEDRVVPATFTVFNTNDSGTGSLRDAITLANVNPDQDQIVFDSTVFATPQTITLTTGELLISENLTLSGPGAKYVTITNPTGRAFNVNNPGTIEVEISGLTISGNSASDGGAAVLIHNEKVTLRHMVISNNTTSTSGGAILAGIGSYLEVVNSAIVNNKSLSAGGAIRAGDHIGNANLILRNSTISGNSSFAPGGGIYFMTQYYGNLLIHNSTITNNTSYMGGGGLQGFSKYNAIISSIISGNKGPTTGTDLVGTKYNTSYSAIGSSAGWTQGSTSNDLPIGAPLGLLPLADNGGGTFTHALLPNSPAINAGLNSEGFKYDQRGVGFDREVPTGFTDIGAFERVIGNPLASANAANVTVSGGTTYTFTVTYTNEDPMQVSSIIGNNNAVRVTGPGGFDVPATYVSIDNNTDGSPRTATYSIIPPGGTWYAADNGTYSVFMQDGQVKSTSGKFVPGGLLTNFQVNVLPFEFIVNSMADDGSPGTLRWAITEANAKTGTIDVITFDKAIFTGLPGKNEIVLTSLLPAFTEGAIINGPGKDKVTISGAGTFRVFDTTPSAKNSSITIRDVTIANGKATVGDGGGAIFVGDEILTLERVTLTGNTSTSGGGAITVGTGGGLIITDSLLAKNSASSVGGAILFFFSGSANASKITNTVLSGNTANSTGGAIEVYTGGANLTIESSTLSGNANLGFWGGSAIRVSGGSTGGDSSLTIRNSTLTGNSGGFNGVRGGAIYSHSSPLNVVISNSIIAENSTGSGGGGIQVYSGDSKHKVAIYNSTIVRNTSMSGGGIFSKGAPILLESTVVAGNIAGGVENNFNSPTGITANKSAWNLPFVPGSGGSGNLNDVSVASMGFGMLSKYGGPTETISISGSSVLRDVGSNVLGLLYDQRGVGFDREIPTGLPDIGAFEFVDNVPAINTWISGSGGDWHNPANWSSGIVPQSDQKVTIPALPPGEAVTFSTGTATIESLSTAATVRLTGGNLTVNSTITQTGGAFTLLGGKLSKATIESGSMLALTASGGTLAGVTIAAGATVDAATNTTGPNVTATVQGGLVLNGVINLGNAAGSVSGRLKFAGTQTLSGSGSITFGTNSNNGVFSRGDGGANPAALTIGPGISIGEGTGTISGQLEGDSLVLGGFVYVPSGRTLTLGGKNWTNTGTISADPGSTVVLGGSFTPAAFGQFEAEGARVELKGTLVNGGTTLNLLPTLGNWHLAGGTVAGGTLDGPLGTKFVLTSSRGQFTGGVTIASNVIVDGREQSDVHFSSFTNVTGGMVLNGIVMLGNESGTKRGDLNFIGTQTLSGNGSIIFGKHIGNTIIGSGYHDTFTIGADINISGGSGTIRSLWWVNNTLIMGGKINVPSGGTLTIGGDNWQNTGVINAEAGSTVVLEGSFTAAALGQFEAAGAAVHLNGTLNNSGATLNLTPNLGNWHLAGGTIAGGTLSGPLGAKFTLTSSGGKFTDGVTVSSTIILDGTTGAGGTQVTATVQGGLVLNGVINLGNAAGSVSGRLGFLGTQTLSGSGSIVFGKNPGNEIHSVFNYGNSTPVTLTIGPNINIGEGSGIIRGYFSGDTVVMGGHVYVPSGRTLTIAGKNWTNTGTISADPGSTVVLGGSFTPAALGQFEAEGAAVRLSGTLVNAGTTLNLTPTFGNWHLAGGTVAGGTLSGPVGAKFTLTSSGGKFTDGVTVNGTVMLDAATNVTGPNVTATVQGGLVLNSVLTLGNVVGTVSGRLEFAGTQTLSGSGKVIFGGSASNGMLSRGDNGANPATLTIGPGVTIDGGSGSLAGIFNSDSVAVMAAITAKTKGGNISIAGKAGQSNLKSITAVNGGIVSFGKSLQVETTPVLIDSKSTLAVAGDHGVTLTNMAAYKMAGTLLLNGQGTPATPQLLEVLSQDLGLKASAFENNFALGSLSLANNTYVKLMDVMDNAPGVGPEAVYVNSLIVPAGSTLDLNGLNVYARLSQIGGTITGGSISQMADSGALAMNSQAPGSISVTGELDNWTFFGYGGRSVTVTLDPNGPFSPTLQWGQVRLLDSKNAVLASSASTVGGALLSLNKVVLPADGVYTIAVNAAPVQSTKTGNYAVGVYDATASVLPLNVNENINSVLSNAYAVNQWTFAAAANTQVQLLLQSVAMGGLSFTLTGPNGYTGFAEIPGDSPLVTLPSSGQYVLTAQGTTPGGFTFKIAQTGTILLQLGTVYNGDFVGSGQPILFEVTVPASAPFTIELAGSDSKDRVELYAGFGLPPTRGTYGYRASNIGASQRITVPNATAGTWYVLVYAESIASPPSSFTLLARSFPVVLDAITPVKHAGNATVSMTLNGAGFNPATSAELVNGMGMAWPMAVSFNTFTQMSSTVNLTGVPQGIYSVRVINPGGASDTLANAFTVTPSGSATFESRLILPAALGLKAPATLYLEYSNTGVAAMPAPLLVLESKLPEDKPLLTLDPNLQVPGFWTSATPNGFANSLQILAGGRVPGLLSPGESITVPIFYAGMQEPWSSNAQFQFGLRAFTVTDSGAVNWGSLQASLQPPGINSAAWSQIYAGMTSQIGNTWGQYVQFLNDQSAYLSRLGQSVTSVDRLWNFAIQQYDNAFSPIGPTLTSAIDVEMPSPGTLSMSFGRVFGVTLYARNLMGPFGTGWSTPWQTRAISAPDGTITIIGTAGTQRAFQPDSRYSGVYFSQTGDAAVLRADGTGLLLTEADGSASRFSKNGSLDYIADANGNRITAGYTGDRLTSLTHSASGNAITIGYNPAGLISTISDSQGRSAAYSYDASNKYLLSVLGSDGRSTSYAYATTGMAKNALTTITYPGNTHQYFSYDNTGRLYATARDNGIQPVSYSYTQGKVVITDTAGQSSLYFDERGLLIKSVNPLNQVAIYGYDSKFHLSSVTNALGQSQTFAYNAAGAVTSTTDFLGYQTKFTYSGKMNRLASVTNANGTTTSFSYNAGGNLIKTQYANGTSSAATYDSAGNKLSFTNPNGQQIVYNYNLSGQIVKATFSDGSHYTYNYDALGQLKTATDAIGITAFTYDSSTHDVLSVTYPGDLALTFTYNSAGQRTAVIDQMGHITKYNYDAAGRLAGLVDGSGNPIVTYAYNAAGRLSQKSNGNGTSTTYAYDAAGNVTKITNNVTGGSHHFNYSYNALGLLTSETTPDGIWTYSYDANGQLIHTKLSSTNPNIPSQDYAYIYDAVGNRITAVINGVTTPYTTNAMNQYVTVAGIPSIYDANGNLTGDGINTYTYNALNQLVGTAGPGGTTTHTYNALGQRIAQISDGIPTRLLNDPSGPLIGIFDGAGASIAQYAHGLDISRSVTPAGVHYFNADARGSTSSITSAAGHVINQFSYDPFGRALAPPISDPFQYLGTQGAIRIGDGQYLMGQRSYQASLGRLINMGSDPFVPGSHPYTYLNNNPVNYSQSNSSTLWQIGRTPGVMAQLSAGAAPTVGFATPEFVTPSGLGGTFATGVRHNAAGFSPVVLGATARVGLSDATHKAWGGAWNWLIPTLTIPAPIGGVVIESGGSGLVNSFDPNALVGPGGYGKPNFVPVKPPKPLPYTIQFENDQTATSPSQTVTITQQLDPGLDWSTLEFTSIGWADTVVHLARNSQFVQFAVPYDPQDSTFDVVVEAGVQTSTGLITITFRSIDPDTQLPPSVLYGFLPPEDGTGRGQGEVHYTILPKDTLATGTEIRGVAYITFDTNPPIATDLIDVNDPSLGVDPEKQALVTIDAGLPTSSVAPLPPVTNGSLFNVEWSGEDAPGGAGLRSFDIYLSISDSPYFVWLQDTTETSAQFFGAPGNEYRFYSIAIDNVGQRQSTPATPDAITTIPPAPAIGAISSLSANGAYVTNETILLQVQFTESVILSGGHLLLTLDTGATLTIAPFTGSEVVVPYTISSGELSPDLNVVGVALESGATLVNAIGEAAILDLPTFTNLAMNANLIINPLPPTTVSVVTINLGSQQRSRLTTVELDFAIPVLAEHLAVPGAITFTRTSGGPPVVVTTGALGAAGRVLVSPAFGPVLAVTLTFDNANGAPVTPGVESGSLADGRWQLSIPFLQYTSSLNDATFRRLFGDHNNDGTIDAQDFAAFGADFGTSQPNSPFDFNADGTIDASDFAQFGSRFGLSL